MDTKTSNPLSQYFGEMDKKNARTKVLNNIFEQIHPHKSEEAPVPSTDKKPKPIPHEALH
jgi:hypothetical protein